LASLDCNQKNLVSMQITADDNFLTSFSWMKNDCAPAATRFNRPGLPDAIFSNQKSIF
jgi:hypothetical protein